MGNLTRLVALAKGDSIWFLGCGDYPLILSQAMEKIAMEDHDSIRSFGTAYISEASSQNVSHIDWNPVSCNSNSVLYESSFNSMIFPRNLIEELLNQPSLSGDSWPHLEWLLAGHSAGVQVLRTANRLVCHDDSPASWWDKPGALLIVAREFAVLSSFKHKSCRPLMLHKLNHLLSGLPSVADIERGLVSKTEWRHSKAAVLIHYLGAWKMLAWLGLSLPQALKMIGKVAQILMRWARRLEKLA